MTSPADPTRDQAPDDADGDVILGRVLDALRTVYDPEIPVNIYDMGLIYDVKVDEDGVASVRMTLTSPACPVAGSLPGTVESCVKQVNGVRDAKVELVWEPPWTPDRMSEDAKLLLNIGGVPPMPPGSGP